MNDRVKNKVIVYGFASLLICVFAINIFGSKEIISNSERRLLHQFPTITSDRVFSNEWTEKFELYALDQFLLREKFRELKSFVTFDIYQQMDNNRIFEIDQNVYKLTEKLDENSIIKAAERINNIAQNYFEDSNVFYAIIPDKSMYINPEFGYPILDYNHLLEIMGNNVNTATNIPIYNALNADSYFRTDVHWKQESLLPLLTKLGNYLAFEPDNRYETATLEPFYGGYYGQSALNIRPEELTYLFNDSILDCIAVDRIKNEDIEIYNTELFNSIDPYSVFMSGPVAVIDVVNPNAANNRELVVFRDSFASSIIPLMLPYYSKITIIDLRYVPYEIIPRYIESNGQDVLFLYSAILANSSYLLR